MSLRVERGVGESVASDILRRCGDVRATTRRSSCPNIAEGDRKLCWMCLALAGGAEPPRDSHHNYVTDVTRL